MADLDDHPDFDLDTALSADLDGELDDYARELGMPIDVLRARIDTSAARERRTELGASRATLAATPALDDVTRRRLLAGAASTPTGSADRPDRSWMYRIAGAAALVLVVVVGVLVINGGSSDDGADSAKSSGGATTAATGDVGDVGRLDQAEIDRLLGGTGTDTTQRSGTAAPTESGAPNQDAASVPGFVAGADTKAVADCAAQYSAQGEIRFRGSGTYQGRPAVVLGIDAGTRTIVFVVAADDCNRVLYSASR